MSNIPEFNFPAFHAAAKKLREQGHTVFNPAENDEEKLGKDFSKKCPSGSITESENLGFSLREALADDLTYICLKANAIAMLPGWEFSSGATAEWMTAKCLRHRIIYL